MIVSVVRRWRVVPRHCRSFAWRCRRAGRRRPRNGSSSTRTTMSQNVLTAARALQQINNQITSLQNEAQMLINQARNLASLPYSSLQQLAAVDPAHPAASRPGAAHRLRRPADRPGVPDHLRQRVDAGQSDQQLVANAQQRWQNTVGGLQDAMRVQAGVVGNLDTNRDEMSALVGQSQCATGALAGGAGRQSAPRAPGPAARRPHRRGRRAMAGPKRFGSRARGRRRAGPRAAPPLPDARRRLSARQRPHVPRMATEAEDHVMDGKLLARLGAVVFVAVADHRDGDRDDPERRNEPAAQALAAMRGRAGRSAARGAAALPDCSARPPRDDAECLRAWAETREPLPRRCCPARSATSPTSRSPTGE